MKTLFYFLLFLYFTTSSAQFAHINDPDGHSNLRSSPEKGNNIIDVLQNKTLVYSVPVVHEGEWRFIEYSVNGEKNSGWIHESRLKYVTDHQKIPLVRYTNKESELAGSDIKIVLKQRNFDPQGKKIGYNAMNPNMIDTIDEVEIWGTDGGMPRREYESITVWFGTKRVDLPDEAIRSLHEPSPDYISASYEAATDTLYIDSLNSDAAGGYEVLWIIEKGAYKERHIAIPF